jgi:succinate-acetate transporter protein
MIAALALAYGGIAQLVAGIWEFRTGNTFGAVAFCSFGAFWISFFFIVQSVGKNVPTEVFSGLGLYLWMWGIFTTYMFFASLRTTGAIALVFLLLAVTFIILGIGNSSLAGIWEFRTGNTFGAVAFCSYGAFWISFFFIVQSVGKNVPTEVFSGLGLYLWMWGIFTTYMFICSLRTTGAISLVFLLLAITYIILGIGNSDLAGTTNVINGTIKLGGYFGIATAIAAWYASFAAVINSTFGRTLAPVFPLRRV